MGKKKIKTLLATSAMVGVAPLVMHYATNQNNMVLESSHNSAFVNKTTGGLTKEQIDKKSNKSNTNEQNNTNKENNFANVNSGQPITEATKINIKKDLEVNITNINLKKESPTSPTTVTQYIPEDNVPTTGNIVNSGSVVTYQISVSLRSRTGQLYNIPTTYLTANPSVTYTNNATSSPQEQKVEQELTQAIDFQLGKLQDLTSTSTFTISVSFKINSADWNAKMIPNIVLHVEGPNDNEISIPVDAQNLRETNIYVNNIFAKPSLTEGDSDDTHYLNIEFENSSNSNIGVYSPSNQKPKSLTFNIINPDPSDVNIIPLDIPGLTKNANGTYTISSDLIGSVQKLFKVVTDTKNQLRVPISVNPINETMSSGLDIDNSVATENNYYGGKVILTKQQQGEKFSMSQSSSTGYSQSIIGTEINNNVTFSTSMSKNVPGKYEVYTGSLVSNGQILVQNNNSNPFGGSLIESGDIYCHLNVNAVDILKSGTPEQKAQIMEDITSGNMNGIGEAYTASELNSMISCNKPIPVLNFVYGEGTYNGSNYTFSSSYQTVPTKGLNTRVISRTITYGKLVGTYTTQQQEQMVSELKNGQLSSDGVVVINGVLKGFILSPPNSYTNSEVEDNSISQITDERYGDYSHGLSSGVSQASETIWVTVDNFGNNSSNSVEKVNSKWLSQQHSFNVTIQGNGVGPALGFTNHSKVVINMGNSFKLTGPVQIDGTTLTPSEYKIEGDKLVVDIPSSMNLTLGGEPQISYNAQYTNTNGVASPLVVSASVQGPDNHQGLQYQYNDSNSQSVVNTGYPNVQSYKVKIVVPNQTLNSCIQTATPVTQGSNGSLTTTLTNTIINNNDITKTYYVAGEIPTTGSNNLPGNDGDPSTGGLSTELQTLNTGGAPTWVLPKSAMNAKNEEILTSPSGNDLKDSLKYIESSNSGWIKYKPGMNLNNMIGYFTTPTVGARDEFNMTYNVKLKQGENLEGLPQVVNSAFKYYDAANNIGSTSNIVNITTTGTDLSNNWISTVKEVDGGKLTQQDLDKTVTINGKTVSLKDLIGTGPDVDANYDATPTKLMNEVTLSQEKEALAKLGYQLVNITVNGKVRDLSWFQNTGIVYNSSLTEVVFNIKKIAPTVTKADTTVTENYSNGEPVTPSVTTTNDIGAKVNTGLPELPSGYQVIKVTVNGQEISQDEVPITQSKDNQTIVYTIGKIPTYKDIVKVVDSKGNQVGNIETATGETGKATGLKVPEIPKGYHIVSITNTTKGINGIPTTFGDSDNTTIYHIEKDITDKVYVDVKTDTGTIITPSHEVASGAPGSEINVEMPDIPDGYHIVKVTVDNKVITPDTNGKYELPKTLSDNQNKEVDDHIEVIVAKNPTTTVEEKYQDGTSVVPNKTTVNLQGTKVDTGLPELPSGYQVIKVTVNGQEVPESEVPTVQSAKDQTIVYTIGKVSTDTVKVVDESNNQIGSTVSKTGVSGTETGLKAPTIPNGYHIVNVTDNGKVITTGVPSKFTDNNQNIVYHIAKNVTTTVKEVYSNGEPVTPSVTTTNDIGAKVNTGLPELPKGYQVVKVTVNGQEVTQSKVPSTQGSKDQVIIYTIGKQPTDTIKVINEKGIQVGKTVSVTGDTGSKTGLEVPTIPNGYHIVSETINGKAGTGVPNTFGDSDTNIIYNIAPNVKDETYGSIVTDSGKILVPVTPLNQGAPGTKATVQMPNIPEGYKIVKVTINGEEVTPNKDNKYEVTYDNNVSKEVDNKIVITVKHIPVQDTIKVMEGSKVISTTKTKEGMPGEDTGIQTPNIPNGYHIDKITVDGNTVTTVPKTFGNNNQTIIYHLIENKVNDIKADVVTESGQPLVNNTTVAEGPEGSDVTCNKTEIPEGYHLVKVEYNGKVISSTTGGKVIYMLPNTIPTGKAGQLTYVVAKNTSTVNVKVVGGPEPYSHTTSGTVGSNITGEIPTIPKGYKVTNITVNGHTVSEKDLPKTYGNKTYNIIYHVTKIPTGDIQQTGTTIYSGTISGNSTTHVITNIPNVVTGNTGSSVSNSTISENGNTEILFNSSSVSGSTGSTYTDNNLVNGPNEDNSTAQTVLPHTGLNVQGAEHTTKEAGALAGIMAMISGLLFFRRKK